MNKPQKKTTTYYDYHECRNFLQEKYGYDERDFGKKFKPTYNEENPYLDFWHWVIDKYEVHNGCYIIFSRDTLELKDDYWESGRSKAEKEGESPEPKGWIKEIYTHYIEEFADENGELEMYVAW